MSRLHTLGKRAALMTGTHGLSADFINFAKMHALYNFASTLSSVFISTYLFKTNSSFLTVGLYYLYAYFFELCACLVLAAICGRLAGTTVSRIGLLMYTFSYLALLIMQDQSVHYYPLVAFLSSTGCSFYWVPYHRYSIEYTTPENRQQGMGFLGVTGNFIMLIAPIISGIIISGLPGVSGYMTVFVVSVVSFLCAALVTRKMPSVPSGRSAIILWEFLRDKLPDKPVLLTMLGYMVYGVRDGVYMYYLNILIYSITPNEFIVGMSTTGRGVLAIIAYFFLGHIKKPETRVAVMVLMCVLSPILSGGLFVWYSFASIILLNVLDSGVQAALYNGMQYISYEMSDYVSRDGQERRMEALAVRNAFLNVGHVAGMVIFLLAPVGQTYVVPALLILNLLALPAGFLLKKATRLMRAGKD